MKTAILAAAGGYKPADVKPWTESLIKSGFDGKVFVVVYDNNIELMEYFKSHDFYVLHTNNRGVHNVATQRFEDYMHIMNNEITKDINLFLHTDIRDVVFQTNPDTWLRKNIGDSLIVATAEGCLYKNEDWNGDGMQKQFGKDIYDKVANKETLCSGIIGGTREGLVSLFTSMLEISWYATEPWGFIDQHFFNLAIRFIYEDVTKIVPADSPWVLNCGTMIAIPMNTPDWSSGPRTVYNSYERFRKGTFIENMLVDLPYMDPSNTVCTPKSEPYAIIHQYDRFQPWKEILIGKEKDVTVVTALYDLKRSNWKGFERPFEQYKEWMKNILSYKTPMVIYVDPADVDFIQMMRSETSDITKIIPMKSEEFFIEQQYGKKIREVMKSSEFLKDQTVPTHPQICVPEYNILMHEKLQFVKRAIDNNYFGTDHFMWLDAGVYHMNARHDLVGSNFPKKKNNFLDDKLHFICVEEPTQLDLDLEKFYKGHNVKIIGTSWMGHKNAIIEFEKSYTELINESLSKNLMDQDQSFLTVTSLRNPEICQVHKGTWVDALNLWS
jgi:protein YibB